MFRFLILFSIFSFPSYSQAQIGAILEPSEVFSPKKMKSDKYRGFENSFLVYFSTYPLYEIFASSEPEKVLLDYSDKGIYRTELVYLFLMAYEKNIKIKSLFNEVLKGKTLSSISKEKNYDIDKKYFEAMEIKKKIEKDMGDDMDFLNKILNSTWTFNENE
jgi:hypothetical protein